MPSALKKDAAK